MSKKPTPETKSATYTTRIMACKCAHPYQDQRYGKGQRVFNQKQGDKKKGQYVCTVCGSLVTVG